LGVTPSTSWASDYRVFQFANSGALWSNTTSGCEVILTANAIWDGSAYKYKNTKQASQYVQFDGAHEWFTAPSGTAGNTITFTQAMTLDASGNLGVGTTSPVERLTVAVAGTSDQISAYRLGSGTGSLAGYVMALQNSSSAKVNYAGIYGRISSDTAASESGDITFYTRNSGTYAERARITSGGYFKASNAGTYAGSTGSYHEMRSSDVSEAALIVSNTNGSYTGSILTVVGQPTGTGFNFIRALDGAGNTVKFNVRGDGDVTNTNNSYGAISDAKVKTDIVDAGSQWDDVKAIRFRKFKMKDDPQQITQLGVVAQELEQTSPGLVSEHADCDAEGNDLGTTTKSVKTSILLMKAAVALQEAMARIEQLEADVAALKGT
jgi:hypothetical protein